MGIEGADPNERSEHSIDRREFAKGLAAVSFAAFASENAAAAESSETDPTMEAFDALLENVVAEDWQKEEIREHFAESTRTIKHLLLRYLQCYENKKAHITEYTNAHNFKRVCQ